MQLYHTSLSDPVRIQYGTLIIRVERILFLIDKEHDTIFEE